MTSASSVEPWAGKMPTKRTVEMLAFYFMGVTTDQEVLAHLARPDNTDIKLQAKDEPWKNSASDSRPHRTPGAAALHAARYQTPIAAPPRYDEPATGPHTPRTHPAAAVQSAGRTGLRFSRLSGFVRFGPAPLPHEVDIKPIEYIDLAWRSS